MAVLGAGRPRRRVEDGTGRSGTIAFLRRRGWYERHLKRPLDFVGGLLLLVILSPVLGAVGLVVKIFIGSPVIFRQERVGFHGEGFTILKFRTMIPDRRIEGGDYLGSERRTTHKSAVDPRVTPVGNLLRKWSLDELPQLWNVVRGDMSLVGPRPELPEIVHSYEDWQHARHSVKPGLTGSWQISSRNQLLKDCTQLDLGYIETLSFASDLKILLATPLAVLGRRQGF